VPWPVSGHYLWSEREVPGQLHPDQFRREMEQQRCVQLAALNRRTRLFQERPEIHGEDVDHLHGRTIRADCAQRLEMRIARLSREHYELVDACPVFPGLDKFVHDTVQRPAAKRRSSRKGARRRVYAILDRGSAGNAESQGKIVGQPFHDDGVTA
jgi:hypothetical protein